MDYKGEPVDLEYQDIDINVPRLNIREMLMSDDRSRDDGHSRPNSMKDNASTLLQGNPTQNSEGGGQRRKSDISFSKVSQLFHTIGLTPVPDCDNRCKTKRGGSGSRRLRSSSKAFRATENQISTTDVGL